LNEYNEAFEEMVEKKLAQQEEIIFSFQNIIG